MNFYFNYFTSIEREHINCHRHLSSFAIYLFLNRVYTN